MPFTPKRMGSLAYSLVMFLVVSVLAGVLVAGLFIPFAGMAGVTSNAAAAELDSLPAELATPAPATRSKVLMGNGKTLAYFYDENRIPVKLKRDRPGHAAGAARHRGPPLLRARRPGLQGHDAGPGPQLRRRRDDPGRLLDHPAVRQDGADRGLPEPRAISECVREAQAPTVERKIRELRYAIALEKKFTKDQILERYLNIAYYGEGAYGVEAAARHYFSTKRQQAHLGAGRDAGRTGAEPGRQQPGAQPQRGARPARRGAQPDGRARS